ncbi:MAG: Myo-inositol 2-dehydrogenase [Verrucomicrobiae bacterium]|nr:Myo-inositol 2-dehydrogenase [Verrucomicrobiae bacterium]
MKTIKLGIVGTGGMANHHAQSFQKMAGVELTSCLDVVPGRADEFAKKHNVKHSAKDIAQLLDQVDAVAVVTPDRFHAEPALAVLKAGKHLLCEKPLCPTLAEAKKVAQAAEKAARKGAIHMINFSYRYSAAFQQAIRMVRDGKLGALRHVHSYYLQSWLSGDGWGNWSKEGFLWRLQTTAGSGGVLGDVGCHILDLTTGVAGEVARIRCELRTFPKRAPTGDFVTEWQGTALDANDTAIIELEFTDGAIGIVHTTRWATGHNNSLRLEAHGTEGALMFDLDRDFHKLDHCLGDARHKAAWTTETLTPTPSNYERFITAIRTGQPDQPDIVRGAQVQAYLDACERSAKSGRWEKIRAWD